MASLPMELVIEILTLSMESEVPMDLGHYLEAIYARRHQDPDGFMEAVSMYDFLDTSQHEHQTDWVVANSVCHAWKRIGKKAFFRHETFIVKPSLLWDPTIESATHTARLLLPLDSADRETIITEISHVIVPMRNPPNLADIAHLKSLQSYSSLRAINIFPYPNLYRQCDASALKYPERYDLGQSMKKHLFLVGDWVSGLKINYVRPIGELNKWRIKEWEHAVKEAWLHN